MGARLDDQHHEKGPPARVVANGPRSSKALKGMKTPVPLYQFRQGVAMLISHDELKRLLHYDPEKGYWRWRVKIHPMQTLVGQPIKAVHRLGYVHFSIRGRKYLGHRLAWFYVTGRWPIAQIDHKDLDPANNKWVNLRESTQTQNMGNLGLSSRNKIGLKGVHWAKKQKKFNAQIRTKGKNTHLGYFDCPAAAHFYYLIAADKTHGEFARAR